MTEGGSNSKPKWVKEAILHDMLLEIKDYADKVPSEEELGATVTAGESPTQEEKGRPRRVDQNMTALENNNSPEMEEKGEEEYAMGKLNGIQNHMFSLTPADSINFDELPNAIGIGGRDSRDPSQESDSPSKLQLSPDGGGFKYQDSRESLIPEARRETAWSIFAQVIIPFLIAGLGMVGAGLILDHVANEWTVFLRVPEFIVLVTPLLGLKGNLEMTLASRLSTHANLGHLDTLHDQWHICFGNLALTQVQAIVVGFLASLVALIMGVLTEGRDFHLNHAVLLCATSILTAAITSCALGILMVIVILLSKKFQLNPDNIATPIAASLGDITTLGLLSWFASILYEEIEDRPWISPLIIGMYVLITPLWVWISYRNQFTRAILLTGWPPIIIAMLISSGGGMLLDIGENRFESKGIAIALYQPMMNGVGGNLVSIQASRISTSLHRDATPGVLPGFLPGVPGKIWTTPWHVFFKQGVQSTAARVLQLMVIPGHLIFLTVIHFIKANDEKYSVLFVIFFIVAALLQVGILLYIARILINWFWTRKIDPDTSTIPYLTALGDLIGTGFLFLVFELLLLIGEY